MSMIDVSGGGVPMEIPYMPAGAHTICATINGEPGRRRVVVDAAACERLNADLAELLAAAAAGQKARPVVFFDHKQGQAAAFPRRFRWEEGRGIVLELAGWSEAGRAAVAGSNYNYVSPCFRLGRKDGQVLGLVGGVEVASLVNDPAFERIDPIMDAVAAARAAEGADGVDIVGLVIDVAHGNRHADAKSECAQISTGEDVASGQKGVHNVGARENGRTDMTEETKKKLGLAPDADDAAVDAAVADLLKQRDSHKKKAEEAEAECKKKDDELKAARAAEKEAWLDDLKARGVIAPKDEDAVNAASALFEANAAAARVAYAKMPAARDEAVIKASRAEQVAAGKPETLESLLMAE